jgi:beta-lactamase regulating signal transducer with metallopeptidase domain
MAEIIRAILIMSVSGSIIALLLFALKPLIKNRLPKSAQYYLWLIVIAALLIPVSKLVSIPQYAEHIPPVPIHSIVEANVISTTEQNERISQIERENPIITDFSSQQSPIAEAVDLAAAIYPIVAAAIFVYFLSAYYIFIVKLGYNSVRADIDCKIPVYYSAKATTPMLVGLFRPKIILPDREYSDEQLQAVLLHELTHLRRKDILVKWLSCLACAVHWFNPFVWLVRREIDRACELSCDEAVIARLDTSGRQTYGDTLIYVAADHKPRTALAMSESGRNLKERLGAIMKNKKRTRIAVIVSAVLLLTVAGAAVALGAGSSDKETAEFPVITISAGNGSVATAVDFGYEREVNGVFEIGDAISPLQHAYTEENTIYTTSREIPEQLSITGAEFVPLGLTLFNLTTGDALSEVDLTTTLDPREKLTIGAPIDAGEYVFVIPISISERGLMRIDYAFKVVVIDESTSAETTTQAAIKTTIETTIETTTISETATTAVLAQELIDSNMPNPFPEGSDDNVSYYQPGNHILDNVTVSLLRLVDDTEQNEWRESFDFFNNPPSSLTEYLNLYSFIKQFNISDEDVTEAMSAHLTSDNWQTRVTEEELDLILHGSEADIVSYFASEYSIVVGDKIYSPHWVYTHTIAAYKQAGITPEALQQKLELYADISFTPEARAALNEKLNSYVGG